MDGHGCFEELQHTMVEGIKLAEIFGFGCRTNGSQGTRYLKYIEMLSIFSDKFLTFICKSVKIVQNFGHIH